MTVARVPREYPGVPHRYTPLIPWSLDANASMLQSVAGFGELVTNPGLCDVHGRYDMIRLS